MCTISLCICTVWSSQSVWRRTGFLATHRGASKDPVQKAQICRLIWVFPGYMWFCRFYHAPAHYGTRGWNIVQMVQVTWPIWLPCLYMVKTLKSLLLWNQKADDLGSLQHRVLEYYQVCSNGPPADKRDLTSKYKNLKVVHILNILSM